MQNFYIYRVTDYQVKGNQMDISKDVVTKFFEISEDKINHPQKFRKKFP